MQSLKGKRILMFAPLFYGYEEVLKGKLAEFGAEVILIYENLEKVSSYYQFIKTKMPSKISGKANEYYLKQIKKHPFDYDYVFVIRGSFLSTETIGFMKQNFKKDCKYILYQWDGVSNNRNAVTIAPLFDIVLTFDMQDSKQLNWKYRPLFYIDSYVKHNEKDIDILYMCLLHSDRLRIYSELKQLCESKNLKFKAFMYERRYVYLKRKYLDRKKDYLSVSDSEVSYKPLTIEESYGLYGRAKVIVDYTHPNQTGFTMRTIECLGNQCKMVTNNQNVRNADFYSDDNIQVYSDKLEINGSFLSEPYKALDPTLYNYYSIDTFISEIFAV